MSVEPPELETRVAILMAKAEQAKMEMPNEAAFFLAQRVRSNVRELEGALKRVVASAHFTKSEIDIALIKESLKDLLALQEGAQPRDVADECALHRTLPGVSVGEQLLDEV